MVRKPAIFCRISFLWILFFFNYAFALYLPGLAPVNFCRKDQEKANCKSNITLYVNQLDSYQSLIPYEYHHFDFCLGNENESPVENLGQVLFGERIRPSQYEISFGKDESCRLLCEKEYKKDNKEQQFKLKQIQKGLLQNYNHHWIVDNMPVMFCFKNDQRQNVCLTGLPMGCYVTKDECISDPRNELINNDNDNYYIFNHVDLILEYSDMTTDSNVIEEKFGGRIVAVKVKPRSINHKSKDSLNCAANVEALAIRAADKDAKILYTYSVKFVPSEIKWSSRWDYILDSMPQASIQWFSIINSLVIVLLLSGMVAMIMYQTLHRDIARDNQSNAKDAQEFGWKLVHGDVFRPPRHGMVLSMFLGSGSQLFCMASITLIFACLGFLSHANRGALMMLSLVLYVLLSVVAGYVSARIYKTFGGVRWKTNILMTSILCPGIVFAMFFVCNLILWSKDSSAAVPLLTLITVLVLWFGVSIPVTFVGALYVKKPIEHPVRTNQIPRQVPKQTLYKKPVPFMIMGGIMPFCCILIQLFFILNSIWDHQTFDMFGFLFFVFIILIITCSEATIVLCYIHLCAEDYHWWWRAFLTSGFTSVYVFFYCSHYFMAKLSISGFISTVLYFSYTLIMVFIFFLLTGTIGFFSTFFFVRKIYQSVHVDWLLRHLA